MPTIHELMQASKTALAAKEAAQAAGVGATTAIAAAAAAAAGGAGEGAVAVQQAAAAGAGTAAGETGEEATQAAAEAAAAAAASSTAASSTAAAAAPVGLDALVSKVTDLSITNARLSADLEAMTASCVSMISVVSDSLDRMSIAMGGGKIDISKITPEALVGMHAEHAAKFAAKFPIGGVAAVPAAANEGQEAQAKNAEAQAFHALRVAAAGGQLAAKK